MEALVIQTGCPKYWCSFFNFSPSWEDMIPKHWSCPATALYQTSVLQSISAPQSIFQAVGRRPRLREGSGVGWTGEVYIWTELKPGLLGKVVTSGPSSWACMSQKWGQGVEGRSDWEWWDSLWVQHGLWMRLHTFCPHCASDLSPEVEQFQYLVTWFRNHQWQWAGPHLLLLSEMCAAAPVTGLGFWFLCLSWPPLIQCSSRSLHIPWSPDETWGSFSWWRNSVFISE